MKFFTFVISMIAGIFNYIQARYSVQKLYDLKEQIRRLDNYSNNYYEEEMEALQLALKTCRFTTYTYILTGLALIAIGLLIFKTWYEEKLDKKKKLNI